MIDLLISIAGTKPVVAALQKARMMLPFCKRMKPKWNLIANRHRIERAIAESDVKEFELHIRSLHPLIGRYGVHLPLLDPQWYIQDFKEEVWDDIEELPLWHETHLRTLKRIDHAIEYDKFDLDEWNSHIDRVNDILIQNGVSAWLEFVGDENGK